MDISIALRNDFLWRDSPLRFSNALVLVYHPVASFERCSRGMLMILVTSVGGPEGQA